MSSVLANHLDVHALNEDARKQMPAISNFMFWSYMGKCRSICSLFSGYLDRDGDIFITRICTDTHMGMKEPESTWLTCLPTSCQKQFAAEFKSLLHRLANLPQLPGQIRASSPGLRTDELPSRWPHLLLPCSINTIPEHPTAPGTESSGSWPLSNSTQK